MNHSNDQRIFDHKPRSVRKLIVLPWDKTLRMCVNSIRLRWARNILTFLCIVIVVAFFMTSLTYQNLITRLSESKDVYTRAVMEKAGMFTHDTVAFQKQSDQRTWLLVLSAILCLVGITNTMLMSVTERIREIGTLKCLGALDVLVVRLFLVESLMIGLLGSVIGTFVGGILSIIQIMAVLESSIVPMKAIINTLAESAPMSIALGTALTIIAAAYPTWMAAKMKPVDAMRVEV